MAAFDTNTGLYWDIKLNKKDPGFDLTVVSNLQIQSSIFNLFPTLTFTLANQDNFYGAEGYTKAGGDLEMEIGVNAEAEDLETLQDFVLGSSEIVEAATTLSGAMPLYFVNKNAQKLLAASPAKAFPDQVSSKVIESIINSHSFSRENTIDATTNSGNWLKPSNQSDAAFLRILKNRSQTKAGGKTFMWVDLYGGFNFRGLNDMLRSKAVVTLDFTQETTIWYSATEFRYDFTGIHYDNEDINSSYKEYTFDKVAGALTDLKSADVKLLGKRTSEGGSSRLTTSQPIFRGFTHSKIPKKYNEAMYNNDTFDTLGMVKFRIKQIPGNPFIPGNVIKLKFPHHEVDEEFDEGLSNDYLITTVTKMEKRGAYVMDVTCWTNSFGSSDIDRFY